MPLPPAGPLPSFVGSPPSPSLMVVRQQVPGPPKLEDLVGAGLVGAALGGAAARAAPGVAGRMLELGAKALTVTALEVVGGEQE